MHPLQTPPVARRHSAHRSICRTLHFSRTRYFPSLGLALAVRTFCISPLPPSQRTIWSPPDYPLLKTTLPAVSRTHYGASPLLPLHFFPRQGDFPPSCTPNKTPPRLSYKHHPLWEASGSTQAWVFNACFPRNQTPCE